MPSKSNTRKQFQCLSVSLIMVNYNGLSIMGSLFDACLESILATDYADFELIFVDNASTDQSVNHVRNRFKNERLRILELDRNMGYAGGANRGLLLADGEIIGVLNNDIIAPKDWLKKLTSTFELDPKIGVVCPKLLFLESHKLINSCGGQVNALLLTSDKNMFKQDTPRNRSVDIVFSPAGAVFIFPKSILLSMDGAIFDDDYFAYFEDTDFGWKVNLQGYKVVCNSDAVVYHKRGGSFGRAISPKQLYFGKRNALATGIKNAEARMALIMMPIWIMSTLYYSYAYFTATKDIDYLKTGFLVLKDTLARFKKIWGKREFVRRSRNSRDLPFSLFVAADSNSIFERISVYVTNLFLTFSGCPELRIQQIKQHRINPSQSGCLAKQPTF